MYNRKAKINCCVMDFLFLIVQRDQGYRALDNPKEKQTTNNDSHSFKRSLFQRGEIRDDTIPHGRQIECKSYELKPEPFSATGVIDKGFRNSRLQSKQWYSFSAAI